MSKKIKLLLVDDEKDFLESIAKRLSIRDFDVQTASNGTEALEVSRKDKFDLALLDLKMPGIDGEEVLEILKQEDKYIEVVILTGHGSIDSAVECTKLGAFGYLPKPYEIDSLIDILAQAYEARLKKKFESDQERMDKLLKMATGSSPLAILRELRKLDDEF